MHSSKIEHILYTWKQVSKKAIAVLVDPDKYDLIGLNELIRRAKKNPPDLFLVGGSLVMTSKLEQVIEQLKSANICPVLIFPGSNMHLSPKADGVLFLSLLSGRNPEFLIGQHVVAAPIIREMKLEAISTGYILVESGNATTVAYISNTTPLPSAKTSVAVATAMAGEMLGLKILYLDGGSGALQHVPTQMVTQVQKHTRIPLWVGGGIRNETIAYDLFSSGADLLVVGNHLEEDPQFLKTLVEVRNEVSSSMIN